MRICCKKKSFQTFTTEEFNRRAQEVEKEDQGASLQSS